MNISWPRGESLRGTEDITPTDHQMNAINLATTMNIGLLSGGPGTGKTFTIASFIKAIVGQRTFERAWGDGDHSSASVGLANPDEQLIAVIAPTGKAAQASTKALRQYGLGIRAQTIHRLLGPTRSGHDSEGWGFRYDDKNKLPHEYFFVDEPSMIPTILMSQFLAAVKPGAKIMMAGDPDQLAPVGKGKPFADMINSGVVPHGHLTEIHRFAGRGAVVCAAIRDSEKWSPSPKIDLALESPENVLHKECRAVSIPKQVKKLFDRLVAKGHDRYWDIQVICPVNANSVCSRAKINELLTINKSMKDKAGRQLFLPGDKVVNRRNRMLNIGSSHLQSSTGTLPGEVYVANGEIGIVKKTVCDEKTEKLKYLLVEFENSNGHLAQLKPFDCDDLQMAWAITGHSSQGSQWPFVILVIDDSFGASSVCTKNYWYTVFSRFSEMVATIGPMATLKEQSSKPGVQSRVTKLSQLLKERDCATSAQVADVSV